MNYKIGTTKGSIDHQSSGMQLRLPVFRVFSLRFLLSCMFVLSLWANGVLAANSDPSEVVSPDGTVKIRVFTSEELKYEVIVDGEVVLEPSRLSMVIDKNETLGVSPVLEGVERRSVDDMLTPIVPVKSKHIQDHFNEISLQFAGQYSVIFRAYDNGIAYRFETRFPSQVVVNSELVEYEFSGNSQVYFPKEESMKSHNERTYLYGPISDISADEFASLPALVSTRDLKILITETALRDYPGLWIKGGDNRFEGVFPKYATKVQLEDGSDRNEHVIETADFIARTDGTRAFPWRLLAIAREDKELLTNQLTYQLADPLQIEDPSWIKSGNVAWDWWNFNNIYGVDFRAGVNTETYKYYIDFASEFGIDYIIMDEGWYRLGNLLDVVPEIDVEEIVAHGKKKNVDVILWVIWKTLDEQHEEAMKQFDDWGVAGLKIDFMARDDQWMVNYYWRMAEEAAKHKLLVNFHGAYKPAGLRRAFPNVLTREGVKGLEHNKWSEAITPTHNVTIPFIRMVAGPMDYTPGAMINASPENFREVFKRPMSMGTRSHQMATFVVFESPMQMLADSPSNYLRERESTEFIAQVPTVWDETIVLAASVGEYVVIARRNGTQWFLGAMTNEEPRSIEVDLSFLQGADFSMTAFEDGVNADRYASDYRKFEKKVNSEEKMTIKLAPGGGWVARFDR